MVVSVPSQKIQRYLLDFQFRQLFINELMWNNPHESPFTITLPKQNGLTCTLRPIAEKSGYKVYQCIFPSKQDIPADPILKQIEREVTQQSAENIIIYSDAQKELQIWQWVRHEKGKPSTQRLSRLHKGQSGELLTQKVSRLLFGLDDDTTITDVSARAKQAFDTERVTKKFYDRFQKELGAFQTFISGITEQGDQKWYASLMLNRLMFIYFIQKKGFLNAPREDSLAGDPDYLRHRLEQVQAEQGQDEFHTFYRYFLLNLFSDLNTLEKKRERSPEMDRLLGRIPYLNGGLFDVHQLEQENPDIRIPDEAFTRVFDFFDEFTWYLDDRELRNDKEINPDVLGYIFEKYINQKQMGAYYTKEDITEYISKNTIIPFLFNEAEKRDAIAFQPDGPIWSLLRDDPDRYIYDAVKKGVDLPLPDYIEVGVADVSQRGAWNRTADEEYALPTEIWREVVARRTRYAEVREKIVNGTITSINDLITYNLDITTFARDVLTYCEGPDLLRAFYDSIERVTVLDPTCGSGAFLFAALNILHPLYEACLVKMQEQVDERDRLDATIPEGRRRQYNNIEHFRKILARMNAHANRDYFILKSIILNNLYGVDIMAEATEICKLRLFLKLVSQVERYKDIEPLPDIDFNIRAGNTLVGFASYAEARESIERSEQGKNAYQLKMDFSNTAERIEQKAQEVERGFQDFRKSQTQLDLKHSDIAEAKRDLRQKLAALEAELNTYLAAEYNVDQNNYKRKEEYTEKFEQWRKTHQPFHWFVEFYEIIERRGGFDVIIGNPPYVEYSKVRKEYAVKGYKTENCGNLYALVMERSLVLQALNGCNGMIVPVSLVCTERMIPLQSLLFTSSKSWISSFDMRPSQLFMGASQRLSINLRVNNSNGTNIFLGGYRRWIDKERDALIISTSYTEISSSQLELGYFAKIATPTETSIVAKLQGQKITDFEDIKNHDAIYVHRIIRYFVKAIDFIPYFWNEKEGQKKSEDYKPFFFRNNAMYAIAAMLNSSLFYWFWRVYSDGFHCGYRDVRAFKLGLLDQSQALPELQKLGKCLMSGLQQTTIRKVAISKATGKVEFDEFNPRACLSQIRQIDRVLAQHYGFTDEELDFIINYDIKYRMGRDNGENGESDEETE